MNFRDLSEEQKKQLHNEILSYSDSLGGKNIFLRMIENIKEEGIILLSERSTKFRFDGGYLSLNKFMYNETLALLVEALKQDGDIFDGLKPKKQKSMLNMLRTLKPIKLRVKPKNMKDGDGFSFNILSEDAKDSTTISLMFKIIFFYNIEFAKKALSYE
jgi:hypothetical protein